MEQKILDYTVGVLTEILRVDSPSGFTDKAAEYAYK